MIEFKSGFVSIIGKTNVGKSTLINNLVGEKIAAVVNKPQTTRTVIKAIINRENSQIIIIDTPGIHKPKNKLGEIMIDSAFEANLDADIILFVVDATKEIIGKGEQIIIDKLKSLNKKVILIINKIDLVKKEKLLAIIKMYNAEYNFLKSIPISAKDNTDTNKLLDEVETLLSVGPKYYENDEYTDQTLRQLVEEIVREKSLKLLNEEVPHGLYIEIEKMKKSRTKLNEKIYNIETIIYCQKKSHKGIIIGKDGLMLKEIGKLARYDLEKMLKTKVNLKLWVKIKEDWQNNDKIINKFKFV